MAAQTPPSWMVARLDALERALTAAERDHARLDAAAANLDPDRAASELKAALRTGRPGDADGATVASLRARYEAINDVLNRRDDLRETIDRAIVDVELVAARSVALGADDERWRLDGTVGRLVDDLTALELAHGELAELSPDATDGP